VSALLKPVDILTIKIDEKILPYIIQDIANLIGLGAALKLVDAYKGTSMWIPSQFKPDYHLVYLIGHEAMIKLIDAYGGDRIEIPKCDDAIRAVRNFRICESDKSQSQLAHEYNLTVRQIRNIQGAMPEDDRQEDLF